MVKRKMQDIIIKKQKPVVKDFKIHNYFAKIKPVSGKNRRISKGKIIFGILLFALFLIIGAKVINAFSQAIIRVQLHQEIINVAGAFDLTVQTMELRASAEETLPATGTKTVEKKANGQIIIYNAYGSSPQPLIERTRFETPDGKIYRIQNRITVPSAKIEESKIIPSSIEVTVYADNPGEEYNIGLSDFTIPGFKGDPRYEGFYARSKTAMSGGFRGEVAVISEQDEANLEEKVEKIIKQNLWDRAEAQTPEDFILYPGAAQITFSENQISNGEKNLFTMKKEGVFFAYLLNREELSRSLVKKYLGEDLLNKVQARDMETLDFQIVSVDEKTSIVVFKIQGPVKFIWMIEEEELKKSLIASSEDMEKIFKNYPAIEKASVIFRPSWWKFFPDKTSRIRIEPTAN